MDVQLRYLSGLIALEAANIANAIVGIDNNPANTLHELFATNERISALVDRMFQVYDDETASPVR
jgi:hypothetical protein